MNVTISPEVEDYLMHDLRENCGRMLYHANEHSRAFLQMLVDADWRDANDAPLIDALSATREEMPIGNAFYDCLIFTMEREGYQPKAIIIRASDTQNRHHQTQDLLFRGHRLIEEVLIPAARAAWVKDGAA